MSEGVADLVITIDAKADKAKEVLSELIKESEVMGEGLEAAALAGVAAFVALVALIGKSVEAFAEQDKAVRSLNLSLQNQGMFTEELSKSYQETAEALEKKTGVESQSILSGQAMLQSLIGQRQITPQLTAAIVDMSARTGDLNGSFNAVARAMESGTLAIGRFHIQLDPAMDKSQRLAKIQEILGQKFGGAAEEAVQGLGGWALVKAEFSHLEKQVGEDFAPAFVAAIAGVKKALAFMGPIVKEIADQWKAWWPQIYGVFSAVVTDIVMRSQGLYHVLTGVFHLSLDEIKKGMTEFNNSSITAWEAYKTTSEQAKADEIKAIQKQSQAKKQLADQENQEDNARDQARVAAERLKNEIALLEVTQSGSKILELKKRQLADMEKAQKTHDKNLQSALKADAAAQVKEAQTLGKTLLTIDSAFHTQKAQQMQTAFGELATMQQSSNGTLKALGKAAAIADIIINTEASAMKIISGFSAIPFIGYELGLAMAGAMIAYSGERIANVVSAADGGLITGGIPGRDSVPVMAMPGELVVPKQNFQEVVDAYAGMGGGGGASHGEAPYAHLVFEFVGDLGKVIETTVIKRQRLGISMLKKVT